MKTQLILFLFISVAFLSCKSTKEAKKVHVYQFSDSKCKKYHNLIQQHPSEIFMEDTSIGFRKYQVYVRCDINFKSLQLLDKTYLRHWEITNRDSLIKVFKSYLEKLKNNNSYYNFKDYTLRPLPWRQRHGSYPDGEVTFFYEVLNITDYVYKIQDSLIGFMPNYMDDGNCFCNVVSSKKIKSSKKCRQDLSFILSEFSKSKYDFTNLVSNIRIFKVKVYNRGGNYNWRPDAQLMDSFYMVCTRQSFIKPNFSYGCPGNCLTRDYIGAMYLINPNFYDYKTTLYNLSQSFFTPNQKDTFRFLEPYLRIVLTGRYSNLILYPGEVPANNKLSKFRDLTFLGTKGKYHLYGFYSDIYKKDMIILLDSKKPEKFKIKTYKGKNYVNG